MIYYKIKIQHKIFQVKRLSYTVPLFKVLHDGGSIEIYRNHISGNWSTLFRSNSKDRISAGKIGPDIENFYKNLAPAPKVLF